MYSQVLQHSVSRPLDDDVIGAAGRTSRSIARKLCETLAVLTEQAGAGLLWRNAVPHPRHFGATLIGRHSSC